MPLEPKAPDSRVHRLLWFIGLWLSGVGLLGVVSYALRAVLMS